MKLIIFICILVVGVSAKNLHQITPQLVQELQMLFGNDVNISHFLYGTSKNDFNPYEHIEFELYTRENPVELQRVIIDNAESLKASNFNPKHPSRLIIHGANTDGTSVAIQTPKDGYMRRGTYNVFGVNWGKGAKNVTQESMKMLLVSVGETVGTFIQFLIREGGASMNDMAVVGHSMGATIVSFVGLSLNGTLPVIISQEPASLSTVLLFGKFVPSKSDAKYVEIIHTAIVASPVAHGHTDYFINAGYNQPQCEDFDDIGNKMHCNHMSAIDFYAESIYSEKGLWGKKCKSRWLITKKGCPSDGQIKKMGEPLDTVSEGVYFIKTHPEPPFAMGKEGLEP